MNLSEFEDIIVNSNRNDWTLNSCWGAGSGPSYLNSFSVWTKGKGEFHNIEIDSHAEVGSYKHNLSISIAWGLQNNDDFVEEWANKFPDPKASSSFIDFFYNGVLIYRDIYVSVDGGRCYIPLPKIDVDSKTYKIIKLTVSMKKHNFFRMLHGDNRNFDSYFKRTGIEITDEQWMV